MLVGDELSGNILQSQHPLKCRILLASQLFGEVGVQETADYNNIDEKIRSI